MWVRAVIGFWIFHSSFYVCNIHKLLLLKHDTLLSVTKTNLLREGKQTVTVHCDTQVKSISTVSGCNEEMFNVGMWHIILPLI
jgi:hypothetical protein